MAIAWNSVRDVADGVQAGQFEVGDRRTVASLDDLTLEYRQLVDGPVTAVVGIIGNTCLANLSPVWFDHAGDVVLLNMASHRKKVEWLRKRPTATFLLMNPENPYHWMSIKATVAREVHEDDPEEGHRAGEHIHKMARKYLGEQTYDLRDPSGTERRILFELRIDSVATFGRP